MVYVYVFGKIKYGSYLKIARVRERERETVRLSKEVRVCDRMQQERMNRRGALARLLTPGQAFINQSPTLTNRTNVGPNVSGWSPPFAGRKPSTRNSPRSTTPADTLRNTRTAFLRCALTCERIP